ncbi:hypothetical protein K1T71_012768 [Dendrolimus kikuchii]|uniref:Uncharacterized protein n=1 Tax=Dendrolimus kikuchii TaxID=765133 RepID=A0ACC1CK88_9NEOP|nr:hypothetical protein K1T71_012768 [Dendrolimus kikuchii]
MVVRYFMKYMKQTLLFCSLLTSPIQGCDDDPYTGIREGNIGDVASFSWLGVLRAHFHEKSTFKIAVTGVVMVREKFAIANAEDVLKIPQHILKGDSRVMLLPNDRKPWYRKPKDFVAHPEFEFSTYNTIGLLELIEDDDEGFPVKPICLPSYAYNTSNQLYVIGYSDENQLLEKIIYKLQYVELPLCEEFYSRVKEENQEPVHYQCGFATNNKEHCSWDNGMAIASNASGTWNLIGFGVRGPGCSAPARFIDLSHYMPWIEATTNLNQEYNVYS